MLKNIFIISELFYPNKTSTAYIMTEIANYLANEDYNVNVICADIKYDNNFEENSKEDTSKLKIFRTVAPKGNKNSFIGKLRNSIQSSLSFGSNVVSKVKKNDKVFAVTNPFLLVLILSIIRVFKKFDYILLVHDVFPENGIPAGLLKKEKISFRILKSIYDWAYSKADKLIVLGRDMKVLVDDKINSMDKAVVVENWFDEDLNPNKTIDRNQYVGVDLTDKIVIGFAGNIGRVQNLHEFVKLFIKNNNPKLHLLIIGDGAVSNEITEFLNKNLYNNITYLGPKPRSEQSDFLNACDIGLITLAEGMYGLGVPSKTYNLLSLGKPVLYLGDAKSEVDLLVNEFNLGWSFQWNQEEKIIDFFNNLKEIDSDKVSNAKKIALEKYSSKIILKKIKDLVSL